jgi:hypothetical protein
MIFVPFFTLVPAGDVSSVAEAVAVKAIKAAAAMASSPSILAYFICSSVIRQVVPELACEQRALPRVSEVFRSTLGAYLRCKPDESPDRDSRTIRLGNKQVFFRNRQI